MWEKRFCKVQTTVESNYHTDVPKRLQIFFERAESSAGA